MVIVCEMPQCINNQNKPDMAQQVPHGKHTLGLIAAVSAGYSRDGLCLVLFRAELQRAGWGGGWLHLSKTQFTQAEMPDKRRCMTSYAGED